MNLLCTNLICTSSATGRFDGIQLCPKHYRLELTEAFLRQYADWDGIATPTEPFIKIFARFFTELGERKGEGMISAGRIKLRAFNFSRAENVVRFQMVRHLNAWNERRPMTRIVESWAANVDEMSYTRE